MPPPKAPTMTIGTPAPDFTPPVSLDRQMTRPGLRGPTMVHVSYSGDLSPVRTDHLSTLANRQADFEVLGATLVGISVDGVLSNAAIAEARGIGFDLLADFEPYGAVSRQYGVYRQEGFNRRALVTIDAAGIVRWVQVVDRDGESDRDPGAERSSKPCGRSPHPGKTSVALATRTVVRLTIRPVSPAGTVEYP